MPGFWSMVFQEGHQWRRAHLGWSEARPDFLVHPSYSSGTDCFATVRTEAGQRNRNLSGCDPSECKKSVFEKPSSVAYPRRFLMMASLSIPASSAIFTSTAPSSLSRSCFRGVRARMRLDDARDVFACIRGHVRCQVDQPDNEPAFLGGQVPPFRLLPHLGYALFGHFLGRIRPIDLGHFSGYLFQREPPFAWWVFIPARWVPSTPGGLLFVLTIRREEEENVVEGPFGGSCIRVTQPLESC